MTNQIEASISLPSFSACCLIFNSFCLIACLPNVAHPYQSEVCSMIASGDSTDLVEYPLWKARLLRYCGSKILLRNILTRHPSGYHRDFVHPPTLPKMRFFHEKCPSITLTNVSQIEKIRLFLKILNFCRKKSNFNKYYHLIRFVNQIACFFSSLKNFVC